MVKEKTLKVGFDLDGVLLYNPARITRPIVTLMKKKKVIIQREQLEFYVPKPGFEQFFWELLHESSMWLAPGFKQITELKKAKIIEPYLITGRFAHLQENYEKWRKKMNADQLFVQSYINSKDEQPHLFKERLIKELKLDYFVEDNWDIVQYLDQQLGLASQQKKPVTIIWLSNILDFRVDYHSKVKNLQEALTILTEANADSQRR